MCASFSWRPLAPGASWDRIQAVGYGWVLFWRPGYWGFCFQPHSCGGWQVSVFHHMGLSTSRLTTWRLAPSRARNARDRVCVRECPRQKPPSFYNLILEESSYHFCCTPGAGYSVWSTRKGRRLHKDMNTVTGYHFRCSLPQGLTCTMALSHDWQVGTGC